MDYPPPNCASNTDEELRVPQLLDEQVEILVQRAGRIVNERKCCNLRAIVPRIYLFQDSSPSEVEAAPILNSMCELCARFRGYSGRKNGNLTCGPSAILYRHTEKELLCRPQSVRVVRLSLQTFEEISIVCLVPKSRFMANSGFILINKVRIEEPSCDELLFSYPIRVSGV